MYCFCLSRTFWVLVVSRALNGFLNGNIGVIKSIMGEITDSANVARAFAYNRFLGARARLWALLSADLFHDLLKSSRTFSATRNS